jgi:2-polyprenyl-6-methoxyphenol hydroxylase-like FAD-dependent oxidoreductase
MGLHWGAPSLKSLLPDEWSTSKDGLQRTQVNPHIPTAKHETMTFLQGDTGETIHAITLEYFYRLRRSKLRALLSQGVQVQYNKRLVNITYATDGTSVTAHFEDGTAATGGLLVGADGARSSTRQCLLGPSLSAITKLPYAATFIQQKYTREQALYLRSSSVLLSAVHPAGHVAVFGMQDIADPDVPESWTFFFYISWPSSVEEQTATAHWTNAQRFAQQKEFAKNHCDPWKSALEWASDETSVWYLGFSDWDPRKEGCRWDNAGGRVTMVGDAVHPMTYQRGQGLNHSVTDAALLRDALVKIKEGGDQKELITAFEDEIIARGGAEVRESTLNTSMLHTWEKVKQSPLWAKGVSKNQ